MQYHRFDNPISIAGYSQTCLRLSTTLSCIQGKKSLGTLNRLKDWYKMMEMMVLLF
jgi:hypothetical protein